MRICAKQWLNINYILNASHLFLYKFGSSSFYSKIFNVFQIDGFEICRVELKKHAGADWLYMNVLKSCSAFKFIFTDLEWKLKILKWQLSAQWFCL